MKIDRKAFFDRVRKTVFKGTLDQTAVDTIDAMFDEWERRQLTDTRWLAYKLATVRGECGAGMKPLREYGRGRGKRYGRKDAQTGQIYYGRGLVQLTWAANYKKMGSLLDLPLYEKPDLALDLAVAVQILFEGMIRGTFTGKKLADYFTAAKTDWVNARRIVNGTDKADTFAAWARQFHEAIVPASEPLKSPESLTNSRTVAGGGAAAAGGAVVIADQIGKTIETVEKAHGYLGWNVLGIVLGLLILAGGAWAIYARWDDAGRPGLREIFDRWFRKPAKAARA